MLKVSLISDTHTKHHLCENDLPGGDILIHAGDFMNTGYHKAEAEEFFQWFDSINNYDTKIFIAGNHDRLMENDPTKMLGILTGYKTIEYLQDGEELKAKWNAIPDNTDILVTHGPPFEYLDIPGGGRPIRVGCEMLRERVDIVRPKIHVFGHIHGSYGHYYNGHTHFFNASVLDERYLYTHSPFNFEWNDITNEIKWL
jgi:Icc-related predicted phosphoesterase